MPIRISGQLARRSFAVLLALALTGACSSATDNPENAGSESASPVGLVESTLPPSQVPSEQSIPDDSSKLPATGSTQLSCELSETEEGIRCVADGIPAGVDYFWDSTLPGTAISGTDGSLVYEISSLQAESAKQAVEVVLRLCEKGVCDDVSVSVDLTANDPQADETKDPDSAEGNNKHESEEAEPLTGSNIDNCPTNFDGWLTTFPLEDHRVITEVGPPGRIDPDDLRGHGYFRMPPGTNALEVRMPVDGILYMGSNHLGRTFDGSSLELQYRLEFQTKCEGIRFRFDHIREPVKAIAELFGPEPKDDSRGISIGPMAFKEGDLIATQIGFLLDGNAFFDFGIYDDLKRVSTAQDPGFHNAACYYDFFNPEIASYLRERVQREDNLDPGVCP